MCEVLWEKFSIFNLRLLCFTLFVEHNLLYWTTQVLGIFDSLCRMYICDYGYHTFPMGSVHIWKSQYLHPDGVISDLICLLMPACLKFLWFYFILAWLLHIVICLVLYYFLSPIFILHNSLTSWWDLCCWYMSGGPLVFVGYMCCVCFWSMSHSI